MFPRTLESTLRRAMRTFPAALVTGPRQSGKTTFLCAACRGTHALASLENPDVRRRALNDPVGFLRDHPPPLILDEIQYAPELLSYVKSSIDEDRSPGRWLLSGSQSFPLMEGVSQSLAGRVAVLTLLPFSAGEAAREPGADSTVDDIVALWFEGRGGLPPGPAGSASGSCAERTPRSARTPPSTACSGATPTSRPISSGTCVKSCAWGTSIPSSGSCASRLRGRGRSSAIRTSRATWASRRRRRSTGSRSSRRATRSTSSSRTS
ncbi:MAG: AAA family ATPase [Planctomycetes bacterium]|nr:AAA family ATPase [Planctomycetota bacterium]